MSTWRLVKLPARPALILPWSIINVDHVLPASRSAAAAVVVRSTTVVFAATAASRSTTTVTNTTFVIHFCKTGNLFSNFRW